jgi:hypothetical protein
MILFDGLRSRASGMILFYGLSSSASGKTSLVRRSIAGTSPVG